MKWMKKFFALISVLFVGLSWQKTVFAENITKAEAAAAGSYATLKSGFDYENNGDGNNIYTPLEQAITDKIPGMNISNLVITTDASDVKPDYIEGCPVDVGDNSTQLTDECHVAAYFYANGSEYDAVFYADVETIYAPEDCSFLFSVGTFPFTNRCFSNLTTITFKNFDTSKVTTMYRMFSNCLKLITVNGLNTFKTPSLKNANHMFANCVNIEEIDLSSFDLSNLDNGVCTIVYSTTGQDGYMWVDPTAKIKIIYLPKLPDNENVTMWLPYTYSQIGYAEVSGNMYPQGSVIVCSDTIYDLPDGSGAIDVSYIANRIMELNTCTDYDKIPTYRALYNQLTDTDKEIFNKLKDNNDNALIMDKLLYMEFLLESDTAQSELKTHLNLSPETSQYLVVGIAGFSLMAIFGYYLLQKKKYAR